MFDYADMDNDGRISWKEFQVLQSILQFLLPFSLIKRSFELIKKFTNAMLIEKKNTIFC